MAQNLQHQRSEVEKLTVQLEEKESELGKLKIERDKSDRRLEEKDEELRMWKKEWDDVNPDNSQHGEY